MINIGDYFSFKIIINLFSFMNDIGVLSVWVFYFNIYR